MGFQIFNTLTRRKEPFEPRAGEKVRLFVCGITPYDRPHIGHARTYLAFDVVARALRARGVDLFYLQNVTDVDDKLIDRAAREGTTVRNLAERHFEEFRSSMEALGIRSVDLYARATDYIPQILAQIEGLIARGYAYVVDGSVYYEVRRFAPFGRLGRIKIEDLEAGARVEVNERKRHPEDFALWKARKPGEPSWEAPWGAGRPGWHIEDTAIAIHHLGEQYDLHGGGADLIFPHHEAEIAQAEALTGKSPYVRCWMHTGFLNLRGEKMSKSLGNVVAVGDLLRDHDPEAIRLFFLQTHYRSPIDFTPEGLEDAERALERVYETLALLGAAPAAPPAGSGTPPALGEAVEKLRERFWGAIEDDFNTALALGHLFEAVRELNRALRAPGGEALLGHPRLRECRESFRAAAGVLGVFGRDPASALEGRRRRAAGSLGIEPEAIERLVAERNRARRERDFRQADAIRTDLEARGVVLEDHPGGTTWKLREGAAPAPDAGRRNG